MSTELQKPERKRLPKITFTRFEAADQLGITTRQLDKLKKRKAISYVKLGGKILFTSEHLQAALKEHTIESVTTAQRKRRSV